VKKQEGEVGKVKALAGNNPKRTSYKSNKGYMEILDDVLKENNKAKDIKMTQHYAHH